MHNEFCFDMTFKDKWSYRYKGGGGGGSTISDEQRAALQTTMDWVTPYLNQVPAGQQYSGQMVADIPQSTFDAFDKFNSGQFTGLQDQTIQDLMSGTPAYQFDPVKTTSAWRENYANPVMDTWRETVAPMLREGMNMPGTFYSRGTTDYMAQQAGQFYGGNVAPRLFDALQAGETRGFQSAEAAALRQPGALSLPYQQFAQSAAAAGSFQQNEQDKLNAMYQEFVRQDPLQYANLLAGVSTASTIKPAGPSSNPWASAAAGLAGNMLGPVTGEAGFGGAIAGMFGF